MQSLRWVNLVGVLLILLGTSCKKSGDGAQTTSSNGYFKTQFQDEEQFIVETIVTDLAEQVYYAKNHKVPDAKVFSVHAVESSASPFGAPVYEMRIELPGHVSLSPALKVNGPIWSPEVYQDIAAALAKAVGLEAGSSSSSDDTKMLLALTDGRAETIEQENEKLSQGLAGDFGNASLHEQAATLLGAFTLREHSGEFFEIRSPLCRITAHLTFARLLSGTNAPGVNEKIAEAMLASLMNDQAPAVAKLQVIEKSDPAVECWVNALQACNTGDYRPLENQPHLSKIGRIAWFRAFSRSVDVDIGWSKLTDDEKAAPDFIRLADEQDYSVETGHELLSSALNAELGEMGAVFQLAHGKELPKGELVARLNEMPDRCFGPDGKPCVVGWGEWAGFFQRQICHAIQQNFNFMNEKWGVEEDAKAFSAQCDSAFSGLRLYPFVRRFNCTDVDSYHSSVDDGLRETVATPQLTPSECWNYLCYTVPFAQHYEPNPNPHITEWHKHNPPPGTAYDPLPRFNHSSLVSRPDVLTLVDRLHELAPYDRDISYNLIRLRYHNHPTYEQAQEVYKAVLPFATYAMADVAETVTNDPDRYEALMARASAPDPARYFNLGTYFQNLGREDKAAMYFEKGTENCQNRVLVANNAPWLVRYYLKKGETEKARSLAEEAGTVYSARGIEAQAEFFEFTGDYQQAFEWYIKEEDRYDDTGPLIRFCMQYKAKTGDGRFDGELQKRLSSLFPQGVEKVTLSDFRSAPPDGVYIAEQTLLAEQAGLNRGDVIVAVNGVKVHNFKQYSSARDWDSKPELDLIVWQNGRFVSIKASPPDHRFGGNFTDYPAK